MVLQPRMVSRWGLAVRPTRCGKEVMGAMFWRKHVMQHAYDGMLAWIFIIFQIPDAGYHSVHIHQRRPLRMHSQQES